MVKIIRQIVPANIANKVTHSLTGNPVNYITVHQTGNTSKGANAKMHAKLQSNGNSRAASWHYSVDDTEAYQSFEDTAKCWHSSDGQGPGNTQSVAVEICINGDGNYKKAVENGAQLVRHLLDKHGLTVDKVRQHHDWYPKNCPAQIRAGKDGITWSDFLAMVETGEGSKGSGKVDKAPSKPSKPNPSGGSIVDYLNGRKIDSSFNHRKKLAEWNGIKNYSGTASQNTSLLNKLKNGGATSAPKPSTKGDQSTSSVVDYLVSIKADSSFSNRKKLAQQHGISNYSGTAAQNTKLLKKLRGGSASSPKAKQKAKNVKKGDKVTATKLYETGTSTKNVRKSPITGTVDTVNSNWRNPIRLKDGEGNYIGFTRKEDLK